MLLWDNDIQHLTMKKGSARFDYYLSEFELLLERSSRQKNPALWLYQNNARTILFMLEGLSKLYAGIHNKNKFSKLHLQFKLLEDILGAIDYYDVFAKEFIKNKKIPTMVTGYIQAQTREKIQHLNEVLIEKKWLNYNNFRINRIREKLVSADWLNEKKEIRKIADFYVLSIQEILSFIGHTEFHFTNIESDVHALRRKLRWISIYPQALKGSIQISSSASNPGNLTKYLTKEIISSPFNNMPDAADNNYFLLLERDHYFALSWMISTLGKIKDSGLRVIAIKEALIQSGADNEEAALKKVYTYTGPDQLHIKQLLDDADAVCKRYFNSKSLEALIVGIAAIQ